MITDTETVDYRRALEALRNGVPNGDAVRVLGSNQYDFENAFEQRLAAVDGAVREERQVPGLLIAGGFGTGKSHLLEHLEHRAIRANFVCSRVTISKETPLFDPAKLYRAAVDGAVVSGIGGQAIHEIALALRQNSPNYAELYKWANREDSGVSPLFPATLLLHERLNNDPELVEEIRNFWSGERLPISRVRQGVRQIGQAATFALKAVPARQLALQRFTFGARLILGAGYKGWVLLIDEVELIGRYSALQRGKSYAELARWMGKIEGEEYPGLITVAAITDDFALAILQEKGDRDAVGPRLRSKDTDELRILAARAEVGMRIIEREAKTLAPPDNATLDLTYQNLKEIHGKAYAWDPPDIGSANGGMHRAMRSYVRRWINEWDLKRLYPDAEVVTEEQEVRPSYLEDHLLEQPSEAEQSDDLPEESTGEA